MIISLLITKTQILELPNKPLARILNEWFATYAVAHYEDLRAEAIKENTELTEALYLMGMSISPLQLLELLDGTPDAPTELKRLQPKQGEGWDWPRDGQGWHYREISAEQWSINVGRTVSYPSFEEAARKSGPIIISRANNIVQPLNSMTTNHILLALEGNEVIAQDEFMEFDEHNVSWPIIVKHLAQQDKQPDPNDVLLIFKSEKAERTVTGSLVDLFLDRCAKLDHKLYQVPDYRAEENVK